MGPSWALAGVHHVSFGGKSLAEDLTSCSTSWPTPARADLSEQEVTQAASPTRSAVLTTMRRMARLAFDASSYTPITMAAASRAERRLAPDGRTRSTTTAHYAPRAWSSPGARCPEEVIRKVEASLGWGARGQANRTIPPAVSLTGRAARRAVEATRPTWCWAGRPARTDPDYMKVHGQYHPGGTWHEGRWATSSATRAPPITLQPPEARAPPWLATPVNPPTWSGPSTAYWPR